MKTKQKEKQNNERVNKNKNKNAYGGWLFKILFIINIIHHGNGDIGLSQRSGLDRKQQDEYKQTILGYC